MSDSTRDLSPEDILANTEDLPEVQRERGAAIGVPSISTTVQSAPYVGPYRLLARFPSSAISDVFLGVKRTEFGYARRAVVKVVWRRRPRYDERRRVLLDEARAIAGLDHPNLVTMLDSGGGDLGVYLALEFVDGVDLQHVIVGLKRKQAKLSQAMSLYVVAETCRGLAHAHRATDVSGQPLSLVHRDANPSNILVARTGHVVLTDFGIVRMRDRYQDTTAPEMVKGKFRYLAPEYITQRDVDLRVDIYSLGVVLFECLLGRPWTEPRSPEVMRTIVRDGMPVGDLADHGVTEPVIDLVREATARDPKDRFQTADAFADAIDVHLARVGAYVSASQLGGFLAEHRVFDVLRTPSTTSTTGS